MIVRATVSTLALGLLLWGCSSAKTAGPATPQQPVTDAPAGEDVAMDPDDLRRILMSRDSDDDGVNDWDDNCDLLANPDQANQDGDPSGDLCDACPTEAGTVELGCPRPVGPTTLISRDDWRATHAGSDWDQDGVPMPEDNCPRDANPTQEDRDGDGWGRLCDRCDDAAAPDTIDGCPDGTRWDAGIQLNTNPETLCLETCATLETCHMITSRFPGETGARVRAQCEQDCTSDPNLRDQINEVGKKAAVETIDCDLPAALQDHFRLWDTFTCDQVYCPELQKNCGAQYATYGDHDTCVATCLDFDHPDAPDPNNTSKVGIACLEDAASRASIRDPESCADALVATTTCPRK